MDISSTSRKFWKDHSLSIIVLTAFFLDTLINIILMAILGEGWRKWAEDWTNNFSTELLNIAAVVLLTKRFREKGSAEDKGNNG